MRSSPDPDRTGGAVPGTTVPDVQGVDVRTKRANLRYPFRIPLPHMKAIIYGTSLCGKDYCLRR